MNKPCGCGNPLTGAPTYTMVDNPAFQIVAKQMDHEFVVPFLGGLAKGKAGDYMCEDNTGRRYAVDKEIFERNYTKING